MREATVTADGTAVRIQPGRALVLVGPQGCGKTVLAQALARRVSDHIGSIEYLDVASVDHLAQQAARTDVLIVDGWPRFLRESYQLLALCKLIDTGKSRYPRAEWLQPRGALVFCLVPPDEQPLLSNNPAAPPGRFHVVHMPRRGQGVIA